MKNFLLYFFLLLCGNAFSQCLDDWPKSWFFGAHEFKCKCGAEAPCIDSELIYRLNIARFKAGMPFYITSGYRSEEHNKKVNGAKHSSHVSGHGVDILTRSDEERFTILNSLLYAGFKRIGIYTSHIHVDTGPGVNYVFWLQP